MLKYNLQRGFPGFQGFRPQPQQQPSLDQLLAFVQQAAGQNGLNAFQECLKQGVPVETQPEPEEPEPEQPEGDENETEDSTEEPAPAPAARGFLRAPTQVQQALDRLRECANRIPARAPAA